MFPQPPAGSEKGDEAAGDDFKITGDSWRVVSTTEPGDIDQAHVLPPH